MSQMEIREVILEPGRASRQYWNDIWRYRELFYFLAWRDILVRYKQTAIGIAWSVIRPLLTMCILTVVFGKLAKMEEGVSVPYPILVLCGMLPWQFFAAAVVACGNSLVNNASMVAKIFFPRLILPGSSIVTCLIDLGISGVLLCLMMIFYRYVPGPEILLLPLFIVLAMLAALGVGIWVSALMVRFRDFRIIVPFAIQIGLYISPVGFSSSVVPEKWRLLYSLNPMVGVIDGFRWAILGGEHTLYLPGLGISLVLVASIVYSGLWFFRKTERTFADII